MPAMRALLPLATLALGTWIGLGRPEAPVVQRCLETAGRDALNTLEHYTAVGNGSQPVLPPAPKLSPASPPVGPLPDPLPWPRLNPDVSLNRAWLLAEGPAYQPGNGERLVALTFDDGPSPEITPRVLRLLEQYDAHATFFLIGRYLDGDDSRSLAAHDVVKDILARGHTLGNHTHDHQLLTTIDHAAALAQIDDGAASIERVTHARPVFFRPPYGKLDPFTQDALRTRGQEVVLWSIEAEDMVDDDPRAVLQNLQRQLLFNGGGIILLHDVRPSSADALAQLLAWLHKHRYDPSHPDQIGYRLVDLATYFRAIAAHPQPYADRAALEEARKQARRIQRNFTTARKP
jgi:peptidoglycan/xylan/chitin deacetylase (PgdA/CDA1 family)